MKIDKKSTYTFYEQILINSIELESYGLNNNGYLYDKIKTVYNIFKQEYLFPYNLKRYGSENKCFEEWIKGLPGILNIPFYNFNILDKAKKYGFNIKTETDEDIFLDNYWRNLSRAFFTLKNNL